MLVDERKEKNQRKAELIEQFNVALANLNHSCWTWMNAAEKQEVTSTMVADFLKHLSKYESALQALPVKQQREAQKARSLVVDASASIAEHITDVLKVNDYESPSQDVNETVIDLKPYLQAEHDFLPDPGPTLQQHHLRFKRPFPTRFSSREVITHCLTAGEPYIAYGIAPLHIRIQSSLLKRCYMVSNSTSRYGYFLH